MVELYVANVHTRVRFPSPAPVTFLPCNINTCMVKQAERRKYHYIYKTTCLTTNRYYIGMHSTDNLDDDYLGSGQILWRSIKKYGKENHKREILEHLFDRQSLKFREREIVNEEILGDKLCMNLRLGGEGWESAEASKAAVLSNRSEARTKNPEWLKKISVRSKEMHRLGKIRYDTRLGQHLDADHKRKIGEANSIHQSGSKNSQFGKIWIYSDDEQRSMKVDKNHQLLPGWFVGRKIKFASKVLMDTRWASNS